MGIELSLLRHQVKVLHRQVTRPRLAVLTESCRKWTYKRRSRPGRPPIDSQVRDLILRLGKQNPRWGYQRIREEMLKLRIRVAATTVRTMLLRLGIPRHVISKRRIDPASGIEIRSRRPWLGPWEEEQHPGKML
jgi:hypothetical protein